MKPPNPSESQTRFPVRRRNPDRLWRTALLAAGASALLSGCGGGPDGERADMLREGRDIFRFETFGDEALWTDTLGMASVIDTAVTPRTALTVGLKVDRDALPGSLQDALLAGQVDLDDPATTVALIKLDAVVGVRGTVSTVDGRDALTRVGITCALCHSTVDDSLAPGIGRRLDGWPNRDLDPGAIIALSPAVPESQKAVLRSWGKGRFDPRSNVDGLNGPVLIPPAYGLEGVHSVTYTGDGQNLAYWNRYVSVVEMGGLGSFTEPRLNLSITHGTEDRVSARLPALQAYQLSLAAPLPPQGSFDPAAAIRGKALFNGQAGCARCHGGTRLSDANERLHPPADSMAEPETVSYAARSSTGQYRSTPLRALWQHPPYFHNGAAATLEEVVRTYDRRQALGLGEGQIADLTEYLKSL